MEKTKIKGRRKKRGKSVKETGVDNDSFEMEDPEQARFTAKDEQIADDRPLNKKAPRPKRRSKKQLSKENGEDAEQPSKSVAIDQSQTGPVDTKNLTTLTAVTIHRCDALRVDPHIAYLMVRVHVMDENSGLHMRRSVTDENKDETYLQPICSNEVQTGPGQFLLPIWEQTLVICEEFSRIVGSRSTLIFFEILNCDVDDSPKSNRKAVEQSLDLLAWAFLRPLGANGLPNAGSRKQRLQLYEPIVSGSADKCCMRSSLKRLVRTGRTADPSKNDSNTVQSLAIKAGQDLMACWKAGQSHRIKYPATLYISLNGLEAADTLLPKLEKMQSSGLALQSEQKIRDTISSGLSTSLLSPKTLFGHMTYSLWKRDVDQPCRVPNHLIGCGIPWTITEDVDGSRIRKWSVVGPSSRPSQGAQCVQFSPNGLWLAVGSISTNPNLQNVEINELERHKLISDCVVWLYQYPLVSKTSSPALQLTGHTRTVYAVGWAPTPIRTENSALKSSTVVRSLPSSALSWPLASASADGTVRVWWISPGLLSGTSNDRKTTQEGRRPTIVSVSEEGASHLPPHVGHGSIRAGETSHKGVFCAVLGHPGFVYSLSFRPLGKTVSSAQLGDPLRDWLSPQTSHLLATAGYDQSVRLWNIGSRRAELLVELANVHCSYINSVSFDRTGDRLYSADAVGTICVWLPSGSKRATATTQNSPSEWCLEKRVKNDEFKGCVINHVEVHPTQPLLLVHTRDSYPKMIDLRSDFVAVRFHGSLNFHELLRSCISPCGTFVFSGSEDRNLYVWNAHTGDQVACYRQLQLRSPITAISYHPTDHVFAFTVQDTDDAPLRVYAYDPKAITLDFSLPKPEPSLRERSKRLSLDNEHLEHVHAENQKRKRERIKVALAKLDSVLNTQVKPRQMPNYNRDATDELDELEWRPTFTVIDEKKSPQISARGRPDGESKSGDYSDQPNEAESGQRAVALDHAVALYDYRPERSDELKLRRGDRVQLLYRDTPKWWMAKDLHSGREGFVPTSYLAYDEKSVKTNDEDVHPAENAQNLGRSPSQKSRLSAKQVAQLMRQSIDQSKMKPPSITVQDVDTQQPSDATSQGLANNSKIAGSPSPANLMVLTPRSSQTDKKATMPSHWRPLPIGKDSQKADLLSDRSSMNFHGRPPHSSRPSVSFSKSPSKRPSRPLPELEGEERIGFQSN